MARQQIEYQIVNQIISDLLDRHTLQNAWEEIDEDTQQEIIDDWAEIIGRYL